MLRFPLPTTLSLMLLAACSERAVNATSPRAASADVAHASRPSDPTATWKIPLADAGLSLRSDGQFVDGTYSVYAHGVCGVSTRIFATTEGSNSGDATIQTSATKGNNCGRRFVLVYPDGASEAVPSFNNLNKLQNTTSSIPIGSEEPRRLIVSPSTARAASRCGRVIFGSNGVVGEGTDKLLVRRTDSRTWEVRSDVPPNDRALCENTGEIYSMQVSFVIVSSAPLP